MEDIRIVQLTKSFGEKKVLENLTLSLPAGRITCLMGPSGCGKTTLLRCLAGLEQPESGRVEGMPPRVGFVFQENRLCECFSALANIRLVTGRALEEGVILRHLGALGLPERDCRKSVAQLSGGMARRVAIARAVLYGGDALLLDEPFKGLDSPLRRQVMDYIRTEAAGKTVVLVTHEDAEAAYLGGHVLRLGGSEK